MIRIALFKGFGLRASCAGQPPKWLKECFGVHWERDSANSRIFYLQCPPKRWESELRGLRGLLNSYQWPFKVEHLPIEKLYVTEEQRRYVFRQCDKPRQPVFDVEDAEYTAVATSQQEDNQTRGGVGRGVFRNTSDLVEGAPAAEERGAEPAGEDCRRKEEQESEGTARSRETPG